MEHNDNKYIFYILLMAHLLGLGNIDEPIVEVDPWQREKERQS